MTLGDSDINRLARSSGLGSLPYRNFNNAPVRRAPAPPAPPVKAPEVARPTATVLTLSPGGVEGAPALRVITGMGGLAARPLQVNRPIPELPPLAPAAELRPEPVRHGPAPAFGLLSRALGEDFVASPAPVAAPAAAAAPGDKSSFPLLNAALTTGGVSSWR